ncbi:MAG: c-type cytochrome [Chloroflexota bacterium]
MSLKRAVGMVLWVGVIALTACGGLAGEPPIVATFPPQPTTAPNTDVGYPLQPPDLAQGAQVFATNCTRCHGTTGAGDGELVKSGQVAQMASFTDPTTARGQTPHDFFNTITQGRLDKLMPPWVDKLSEADRWTVALYTYGLSYTDDEIAQGKQIWTETCAACHGETGAGDGPNAAQINRPIGNLTVQTEITNISDAALFTTISEGVGNSMPSFKDSLSEDQRYAAIAYIRTLTVANAGEVSAANQAAQNAQPATTPEPETTSDASEANAVSGTISGHLTNGTAASSLPTDLQISLVVSNQGNLVKQVQTPLAADGSYTFADAPIITGADYVVAAVYRERLFTSQFVTGDASKTAMDMPLTIYELTEDPSVISISGVVAQVSATGDTLEVREVMRFKNSSDRVFTSSNDLGDSRFASLIVALPPGAQVVSFDDPQRYVVSDKDFSFVDTAPVYPNEDHLAVVIYILPYDGNASLIEQAVNYALDGQVRLLMYPQELNIKSDQLPRIGPQALGDKTYQSYGSTLQLKPGDVIRYEVSGAAAAGTDLGSTTQTAATTNNILPILLLIIGGAAVLAGFILFVRGRGTPVTVNQQQLIDALVQQIAEMDTAHNAGELNHDLWQRQRAQLKTRLAELLGDEKEE